VVAQEGKDLVFSLHELLAKAFAKTLTNEAIASMNALAYKGTAAAAASRPAVPASRQFADRQLQA
jgi:hypothetical protein